MSDPLADTSLGIDPTHARPDGEHAALKADNAALARQLAEARKLLEEVYAFFDGATGSKDAWCAMSHRVEMAVRPELYREPQTAPQGQQRPAKARDGDNPHICQSCFDDYYAVAD